MSEEVAVKTETVMRLMLLRFVKEVASFEGQGGISLWADVSGHAFLRDVETALQLIPIASKQRTEGEGK